MMMHSEKLRLLYEIVQVKTIVGKLRSEGKERMRDKGESVRDGVLQRQGFGVDHKFDRWLNFSELRDRVES